MKARAQVLEDEYNSDFYEILETIEGPAAARTFAKWQQARSEAGVPLTLQ